MGTGGHVSCVVFVDPTNKGTLAALLRCTSSTVALPAPPCYSRNDWVGLEPFPFHWSGIDDCFPGRPASTHSSSFGLTAETGGNRQRSYNESWRFGTHDTTRTVLMTESLAGTRHDRLHFPSRALLFVGTGEKGITDPHLSGEIGPTRALAVLKATSD